MKLFSGVEHYKGLSIIFALCVEGVMCVGEAMWRKLNEVSIRLEHFNASSVK